MTSVAAPYESITRQVQPGTSRQEQMQRVVDALWDGLCDRDVSWVGFYVDQPDQPDDRRLILGPHRDKPACSPIGMNGVCGAALQRGEDIIVDDVHALGANYIACDPRDRSEIVIPLFEDGRCWGVLDVDSFRPSRFTESDRNGLRAVLTAAGLSPSP